MRAIVFHEHGGPEVLRLEEVPTPIPRPDQVLVRVRSVGLNHLDLFVRAGTVPYKIPLPHISGCEVAGDIELVGELVDNVAMGERVVVAPYLSCGMCEFCLAGQETTCLRGDVLGRVSNGGFAEYVAVPATHVLPIPKEVSYDAAAAATLSMLTAWHMLITRARVRPMETVLVLAAGSGVGSAAIQIAKLAGARVIATASSEEKLERARQLGADETVNYSQENWSRQVRMLTSKRGVDIVIEHVGEATWEQSIASLARNGRLVTTGATTGAHGLTDINRLFGNQLSLLGSFGGTRTELRIVLHAVAAGKIAPVIDSILPLEQVAEAERRMENRTQFGKILLHP
jgi:NADPH:quinone reductase-like Zn-dependent oxidoreductase